MPINFNTTCKCDLSVWIEHINIFDYIQDIEVLDLEIIALA